MTPQEIFDTVVEHLYRQGRPALDPANGGRCVYHAPDGRKCAVGIFIPDKKYNPNMEGECVDWIIAHCKLPKWFAKNRSLLNHLQDVHDNTENQNRKGRFSKSRLRHEFRRIAAIFDLKFREPKL